MENIVHPLSFLIKPGGTQTYMKPDESSMNERGRPMGRPRIRTLTCKLIEFAMLYLGLYTLDGLRRRFLAAEPEGQTEG